MGQPNDAGARRCSLEVNSELANIAEEMRHKWEEFIEPFPQAVGQLAPGAAKQMLMAVESRMGEIGDLLARRAEVDHLKLRGASFNEVAQALGWSDAVFAHARDSLGLVYENECVLQVHSGRELRFPAYPEEVSYVRVTEMGFELAYWADDEWREAPAEVMGALLGCAMNGAASAERPEVASLVQAALETKQPESPRD